MASNSKGLITIFACMLMIVSCHAQEQNNDQNDTAKYIQSLLKGAATASLDGIADIKVPEGFRFANKSQVPKLLEITHNLPEGNEVGALIKTGGEPYYFVIFEFSEVGYVKDDDKDKLDANALLKSIQDSTEAANESRKQKGWDAFHVTGWETKPFYDPDTHNLVWAIRGHGEGAGNGDAVHDDINYSTRILGRRGTMNADLVVGPDAYATAVPEFNKIMGSYNYTAGNRYDEFRKGDKLAGYGLAALIVGGAGATAAKLGLFGKLWKFIVLLAVKAWKLVVVACAGIAAWFKKMWAKITGKDKETQDASITPAP